MSVFTKLSENDVNIILSHYKLGDLVRFSEITSGTVNSNFLLYTSMGRYILTIFEQLNSNQANLYLTLTEFLHKNEIACPAPIPTIENKLSCIFQDKPTAVINFLAGEQVTQPNIEQCEAIGSFLGTLHSKTRFYPVNIISPLNYEWRKNISLSLLNRFESVKYTTLEEDSKLINTSLAIQEDILQQKLPKGIIHGDLFRDNAMFVNNRLTGVIDFYFAGKDYLLLDISIAVNDWCTDRINNSSALTPKLVSALLKGYLKHRAFTEAETKVWPKVLQLTAWHFWLLRLKNIHFPKPGNNITVKNPNEYKQLLQDRLNKEQEYALENFIK